MPPPVGGTRQGEVIYTVSELSGTIRANLDRVFPGPLSLEGELSNVKRSEPSGHYYFTLKDAASSLRGVMFRSAAAGLSFLPKDGLHVLARGRLSFYEPRGEIQMVVDSMGPAGMGLFHLELQRVRTILEKEGLLAPERKRPIPSLPRTVALITSPQGAAVWDFLRICDQQNRLVPVLLVPARMQGNEAAQDIARALSLVARRPGVDLAVITRGGGSAEDLWVFNREDLARAILKCPVPVVTAIGHEVDVTVADLAADLRVATPTEAAKRIFFDERPVLESLERGRRRLAELELSRVERERRRLLVFHLGSGVFSRRLSRIQLNAGRAQDRLSTSVRDTLRQKGQALASLAGSVVHPSRRLALMSRQIDGRADLIRKLAEGALERRGRALSIMISKMTRDRVFPFNEKNLKLAQVRLALPSSVRHALAESERSLARTAARLQEANPESPLARGFFILTRGLEGGVVALGNLPEAGETVVARTSGLSLVLQVKESRPDR